MFRWNLDLQGQDPQFYALITSTLNPEQLKGLNDVMVTAEQKKAQYNSKQIQKQGGKELYNFSLFQLS